jgi:hypothetical protein
MKLRLLVFLLRSGGVLLSSAFLAVFLPVDWMAAIHQWLGLGEFPRTPIVDYLSRSVAALYGFHGILLFILANNPVRYRPIVRYVGMLNIALGILMTGIDLHAGMPIWWTAGEGPPVFVLGIAILYLTRSFEATAWEAPN